MNVAILLVDGPRGLARRWAGVLAHHGADVRVVADLAAPAVAAALVASGCSSVVAAADPDARGDLAESARALARAARLDPLNVEVVPPSLLAPCAHGPRPVEDGARVLAAVAATVLDARTVPPAERTVEHGLRGANVSRRRLFAGLVSPLHRFLPVPVPDRCAASKGCRACVVACPADAVVIEAGRVRVRPDACTACGRCAAACPGDAVRFPPSDPARLLARARALGDGAPLLLGSARAFDALAEARREGAFPSVRPLLVTCAKAVRPELLLALLRHGARGVVLLPCPPGGSCGTLEAACPPEAADPARRILALAGDDADRVRPVAWSRDAASFAVAVREALAAAARPAPPAVDDAPCGSFGEEARRLLGGRPAGVADGPGLPLARLDVSREACTLCGVCAAACPARALRLEETEGAARLVFDHAACRACGLCVDACPADALTLRPGLDPVALAAPPRVLVESERRTCVGCGAPLLPEALLATVARRTTSSELWREVLGRCPACRPTIGGSVA